MGISSTHYLVYGWKIEDAALKELKQIDDEKDYSYNNNGTKIEYIFDGMGDKFAVFGKVFAESDEYYGFEFTELKYPEYVFGEYIEFGNQFRSYFDMSLTEFLEKYKLAESPKLFLFTIWS